MITVIRGVTLIDGSGVDPIHNAALAFSQERILEVGRVSHVSVPREAHVIEADGLFLLPGLIDTHVHLVYSGLNVLEEIRTPPSLSLLRVVPHAKATLDAGVTTARDAGGTPAGSSSRSNAASSLVLACRSLLTFSAKPAAMAIPI
jgi:imidazolonepropionase-like amidohydrolase